MSHDHYLPEQVHDLDNPTAHPDWVESLTPPVVFGVGSAAKAYHCSDHLSVLCTADWLDTVELDWVCEQATLTGFPVLTGMDASEDCLQLTFTPA